MKKHLTTAGALAKGKKAYHKPSLKSFGKVSVLTRSAKGSTIFDDTTEVDADLTL